MVESVGRNDHHVVPSVAVCRYYHHGLTCDRCNMTETICLLTIAAVLLVKAMNLVEDVIILIMLGIVAVPALYVLGWLLYAW